jgi:PPOX class probable F420-dependent enzyme
MASDPELTSAVERARRAVLVTIRPDGRPRPVPICFVASTAEDGSLVVHSPIDEKPKTAADPMALARVRDIERDERVSLLVDHWDEDWGRLWWIRIDGTASIIALGDRTAEADRRAAIDALRRKYPQYASQALEVRPLIRIVAGRIASWRASEG